MRNLAKAMLLIFTLSALSAVAQEDPKKTARNWKAKCGSCQAPRAREIPSKARRRRSPTSAAPIGRRAIATPTSRPPSKAARRRATSRWSPTRTSSSRRRSTPWWRTSARSSNPALADLAQFQRDARGDQGHEPDRREQSPGAEAGLAARLRDQLAALHHRF